MAVRSNRPGNCASLSSDFRFSVFRKLRVYTRLNPADNAWPPACRSSGAHADTAAVTIVARGPCSPSQRSSAFPPSETPATSNGRRGCSACTVRKIQSISVLSPE